LLGIFELVLRGFILSSVLVVKLVLCLMFGVPCFVHG